MQNVERRVWREAPAVTRREVITRAIAKQLSWVQAAAILGISARHLRRARRKVEGCSMSAMMDQRGGRPRRRRIKAGTIELLCRLKRDVYADFSLRHFYEHVTEKHGVRVSYTGCETSNGGTSSGKSCFTLSISAARPSNARRLTTMSFSSAKISRCPRRES